MSNKFYALKVQPDWRSDRAIGIDISNKYAGNKAVAGDRIFLPLSQVRLDDEGVQYVSQWILERKREEQVAKGNQVEDVNRGLGEVFDWHRAVEERVDRPGSNAPNAIDASAIRDFFDRASEHLKFPKVKTPGVVFKRSGPNSAHPGTVHVTDGGPYGEATYFGAVRRSGEFAPARDCTEEVKDLVRAFAADPTRFAAEQGHQSGSCCFCARDLEDPRSVSVGYGPICAGHWGLPWGEVN